MKCRIMRHFIRVCTVCKGKKDLQTKNTIFFLLLPDTPRYVQWTIQNLLYQTRGKNPLVYKGLRNINPFMPIRTFHSYCFIMLEWPIIHNKGLLVEISRLFRLMNMASTCPGLHIITFLKVH